MKKYIPAILILLFGSQFIFSQEKLNENQKFASLCKVWGFLKYYHPVVAKGKFLWDEELINKIPEVEKANSVNELNAIYTDWLAKLGDIPKVAIKPNDKEYFDKNFNLDWIRDKSIYTDALIEKLVFIEQNRKQDGQFYISRKGIKAELTNELNHSESFPGREIRIVEFFRFWNLVEYFYPHKYKIEKDWTTLLEETIPKILNCKSHTSYHLIYVEMLEKMKDSHAYFHSQPLNGYYGVKVLPITSKYAEGKLIVTGYKDRKLANKNNLFVGDIISKVNNRSIDEIFEKKKKYTIAANDAKKMKIFTDFDYFFSLSKDTVSVTIERGNETITTTIKRYFRKELDQSDRETTEEKTKWKMLENNIGYVNMKNADVQDVEGIYKDLKSSKAIIFDIRNYPNFFGREIVEQFGKSRKVAAKYIYADLDYPGKFYWKDMAYGTDKETAPYTGKIIILVNENSQSRSEWTAMQLQTLDNSVVIGSQTAGSDGESLRYKINAIDTAFTVNGVFYPNKDETQGCGIKIDIEIKPTLKGIRDNRDEVLERAVEFINNGK